MPGMVMDGVRGHSDLHRPVQYSSTVGMIVKEDSGECMHSCVSGGLHLRDVADPKKTQELRNPRILMGHSGEVKQVSTNIQDPGGSSCPSLCSTKGHLFVQRCQPAMVVPEGENPDPGCMWRIVTGRLIVTFERSELLNL